ncbi:hypothetical protein CK203_085435 [Vitis vinifera]|uniref:Uncharacterized protein n=1 Tax=Vitis vinifera TaxID=29760 RepID=A0A438BUN9_VITVI|nr:hypothetical protein CK203_085435 [Vitis vinifera]
MADKTIGGCVRTPVGCLLQVELLNQELVLVEIVCPSIGNYVDHQYAKPQHWRVCGKIFHLIQSLAKMATPSRNRSSSRREEDNFEWRQTIERTVGKRTTAESSPPGDRKIKRENAVLRIQLQHRASSSSAFKRPSSKLKARARVYIS